jgi:arabinogalactan endo-1,4-beta-galactosidase
MDRKIPLLAALALFTTASLGVSAHERAPTPAAPIALANAGFEADGTGVAAPQGWQSTGATAAAFTEGGGRSGGFRLTHYSAAEFDVSTRQTFRAAREGAYTLRGWVRRSSAAMQSTLEVRCGSFTRRVHVPVAWPHQWLQVAVTAYLPRRSCELVIRSTGGAGAWANFDDLTLEPGIARLSVLGADVSSLRKSEDFGGTYDDPARRTRRHRAPSALDILADHGMNFVRLRVWVNPADGYHDQEELLVMARRAQRAGLRVLVDLHYSDSWADPGKQFKPAAWATFDFTQLKQAVYDHTYSVCSSLKRQGTPPAMIQLGNELNSGMLWPDGHTWNPPNWDNLAALLSEGARAVRDCSSRTRIALHLANGGDNGLYRWWFDNITQRNVDFDVIGFSYYGYWHGSLGDLQFNLNDVAARYGKDVFVAETAYPFVLADADNWGNIIGLPNQLVAGYPATPAGQAANQRDVLAIVRAVPNGRGLGAFYWDATWTGVVGNGWDPTDPSTGNAWENQALFDFDGNVLPAVDEYRAW